MLQAGNLVICPVPDKPPNLWHLREGPMGTEPATVTGSVGKSVLVCTRVPVRLSAPKAMGCRRRRLQAFLKQLPLGWVTETRLAQRTDPAESSAPSGLKAATIQVTERDQAQ